MTAKYNSTRSSLRLVLELTPQSASSSVADYTGNDVMFIVQIGSKLTPLFCPESVQYGPQLARGRSKFDDMIVEYDSNMWLSLPSVITPFILLPVNRPMRYVKPTYTNIICKSHRFKIMKQYKILRTLS